MCRRLRRHLYLLHRGPDDRAGHGDHLRPERQRGSRARGVLPVQQRTDLNAAFGHYAAGSARAEAAIRAAGADLRLRHRTDRRMWACYEDINRTSQMVWTSTSLDILAAANDTGRTPQQLSNWFFSAAPTRPQ